jgi:periplasmic divalent cation tolerance protein
VEEGLAACINILPGMVSVYRWNEAVERADETVMLIKTTTAGAPAVVEAVRALHPYQVPAVMVLPVAGGNPDFLSWIDASTRALSTKVK